MEHTSLPRLRFWDWSHWIPPTLPALCGVLSTLWRHGGFSPTLSNLVRLALFLLLVEGGWRMLWNTAAAYDWAAALRHLGLLAGESDTPRNILQRWLHLEDSDDVARFNLHLALAALASAIVLILPAALGPAFVIYSLVILAAVIAVRHIEHIPLVVEVILFALGPWWVGAWTWGGLTPLSAGLSLAFAVCAWGSLTMDGGLRFYQAGLGAALVMLLLGGHAFAAGAVGVFSLAALARSHNPQADFPALRWPLMMSMLTAALAVVWARP